MRLTLLFIIAALLVPAFTFHQYARRNYTLSEDSQRSHNQALKGKLQDINTLNQQLQELTGLTANMPFDDHFLRKVRESKVNSIEHQAELLVNCTKQYFFDENQVVEC